MSQSESSKPRRGLIVHAGHESDVYSVAFSPDGKSVASGSADETVRIWDANNPSAIGEPLTGHSDAIRSVSYSPLGDMVVSGSCDRSVRLWSTSTGRQVGKPLKGHDGLIYSVAFSPSAKLIASGSGDKTIRLWNALDGTTVSDPLKGHTKPVSSVAFSCDNINVISGSDDTTIRIWDINYGMTVVGPFKHGGWVRTVALSPDGSKIASGSDDKTVRLWDTRSGSIIGKPCTGHTGWVMSVAFSPDGTCVASGASDRTVRVWDVRTGRQLDMPFTKHSGSVYSVVFSPSDGRIASCSADKRGMVWNISDRGSDQERDPHAKADDDDTGLLDVGNTGPISTAKAEDTEPIDRPVRELFNLLLKHGCEDLATTMDVHQGTAIIVNGGGFGDIWMGRLHNGTQVAIKAWRANMSEQCTKKTLKRAAREIHTWSTMKHKHIHQLMGVILFRGHYIGMVSEWMENGSLSQYMLKNPQLDRYQMCAQVASGLAYMHRCSVVHGDLKAANVLVSPEGIAKLTDFGLSIVAETSLAFSATTNREGFSVRWAAPELVWDESPKCIQSDVYALGMTMLEIFTGAVPYSQHRNDCQVLMKIGQGILPLRPTDQFKDDDHGDSLWELLVSCWGRDLHTRPSARRVHDLLVPLYEKKD